MMFSSILFQPDESGVALPDSEPSFFGDINFDAVVVAATRCRGDYALDAYFYRPLTHVDAVTYRHAVFRDLEDSTLCRHITEFGQRLKTIREHRARATDSGHRYAAARWLVDAAAVYCQTVQTLLEDLKNDRPASDGLRGFYDYLADYTVAPAFTQLVEQTEQRRTELERVHYGVLICGEGVTVTRYDDEPDYGAEIAETFGRFRQGSTRRYDDEPSRSARLNRIEAGVLTQVAKLYPEIFARLDAFCETHQNFVDDVVARFDREIQFYLGYKQLMTRLTAAGLSFCTPDVSTNDKTLRVDGGFELALADKRVANNTSVVTNDACLDGAERIIVVTGPNQGGKTTFARMIGQLYHLARLGCPVPGHRAKLFICSRILTHFERPEATENLRGKLEDDLIRMRAILERADGDALVVANEIFGSTTSRDARWLGEKILGKIDALDALCVCVTFIDELAVFSAHTVSMVATVEPDDPAKRTFKVLRKPADGLAYARSLAEKHRLTRQVLRERL